MALSIDFTMWKEIDKCLSEGKFTRAVDTYARWHRLGSRQDAKKIVGKRANLGLYRRIRRVRQQMIRSILLRCLAFKTFEAFDPEIRACFKNAADECIEYVKEIRALAAKNAVDTKR